MKTGLKGNEIFSNTHEKKKNHQVILKIFAKTGKCNFHLGFNGIYRNPKFAGNITILQILIPTEYKYFPGSDPEVY